MKILNKIKEIFDQHELKPIELPDGYKNIYDFLRANPVESENYESEINDIYLLKKYREYIPKGWYGFDIGTPIIPEWMKIIDEIVETCIEIDPIFEIHQIEIKFGGIRFYCGSEVIEDLHEIESLIEDSLWDVALIY